MTRTQHRAQLLPARTRNLLGFCFIVAMLFGLGLYHLELEGRRLDRASATAEAR